MPRYPTGRPTGRPQKEIDWDYVDKALVAGFSGAAVAEHEGVHPNTLYARVLEKYGKPFGDFLREKIEKGNAALHAKQYSVAMSGNVSMLIWLGKNRLGQRENPKEDNMPNDKVLDKILESVKKDPDKMLLEENERLRRELEEAKRLVV